MSRLLSRIDERLTTHLSMSTWAALMARRAIYLCQKGDLAAAQRDIATLRERLQQQPDPVGTVVVNLAEAVLCFQSENTPEAVVKARRADVMARSLSRYDLVSAATAWLALFHFSKHRYVEAVESARDSLACLPASAEPWVLARLSLVVGSLLHFFGDEPAALQWYGRSRAASVEEGDEVMIGLAIYNSAAFQVHNTRMAEVESDLAGDVPSLVELGVHSTSNFDRGVGSAAFPAFIPLLQAQLLTLRRRAADALPVLEGLLGSGAPADAPQCSMSIHADHAWCLMAMGRNDDAMAKLRFILEADLAAPEPPEDVAKACHRMAMVCDAAGDAAQATRLRQWRAEALGTYQASRSVVLPLLRRYFAAAEQLAA